MPAAGKTGTTQNWADAWTVGFTPYYTAAFWFGFDRPGQSLGLQITGSTLAGVAWGDYMHEANEGKPYKNFVQDIPEGVIKLDVCSVSGQLLTPECADNKVTAYYLAGTQPTQACQRHTNNVGATLGKQRIKEAQVQSGLRFNQMGDSKLTLDLSFLNSTEPVMTQEKTDDDDTYDDDLDENGEDEVESLGNWLLD